MKNLKGLLGILVMFALTITPFFTYAQNAQDEAGDQFPVNNNAYQLSSPYVQIKDMSMGQSYDGSAQVKGTFKAENQSTDQAVQDFWYSVSIVSKYDNGLAVDIVKKIDFKNPINISPKQTKDFSFGVELPNLPVGEYGIQVRLFNKVGLSQSWSDSLFNVISSTNNSPLNSAINISNLAVIAGGIEYDIGEGPTYKEGDTPRIVMDIEVAQVGTYVATMSFEKMNSNEPIPAFRSAPIILKQGTNSRVSVDVPNFDWKAGVYSTFMVIENESGAVLTTLIPFRYIIGGNIVSVHNVRSTSDKLKVGTPVGVTMDIVGTPFSLAPDVDPVYIDARIEVKAYGPDNNEVASGSMIQTLTDAAISLEIPLNVNVKSDSYYIEAKVYDNATGELLTEYKTSNIEYDLPSALIWKILILLAVILIIIFIILKIKKSANGSNTMTNSGVVASLLIGFVLLGLSLSINIKTVDAYTSHEPRHPSYLKNIEGTAGNGVQSLYSSANIKIRWEPYFIDHSCNTLLGAPATCRIFGGGTGPVEASNYSPAMVNLHKVHLIPRFNAVAGPLEIGDTHRLSGGGSYLSCLNSPAQISIFQKTVADSKLVTSAERVFNYERGASRETRWISFASDFSFEQNVPSTSGEHRKRLRVVSCSYNAWTNCSLTEGDLVYNITLPDEPAPVCGSANGVPTPSAPISNLCQRGTPTAVTSEGGQFKWSCNTARPVKTTACTATNTSSGSGLACTVTRDTTDKKKVTWNASVTAGLITDYNLAWTGDITGTNQTITQTFDTLGPKTATLSATHKTTGVREEKICPINDGCDADKKWCETLRACIPEADNCPPTADTNALSCITSPASPKSGDTITWTARWGPPYTDGVGENGLTYGWSGSVLGGSKSVTLLGATAGVKTASVRSTRDSAVWNASCSTTVACRPGDSTCAPSESTCGITNVDSGDFLSIADPRVCEPGSSIAPESMYLNVGAGTWSWNCRPDTGGPVTSCNAGCIPGTAYNPIKRICTTDCPNWCPNIKGNQPTLGNYVRDADGNCIVPEGRIKYFRLRPDTAAVSCPAYWETEPGLGSRMECKISTANVSSNNPDATGTAGKPVDAGKIHTLTCNQILTDSDTFIRTVSASARCYKLGEVQER